LRGEWAKMILRLERLVKGVKSDVLMKPGGYGLLLGTLVVTGVRHKCFPRSETTRRRSAAAIGLLAHRRLLSPSSPRIDGRLASAGVEGILFWLLPSATKVGRRVAKELSKSGNATLVAAAA
jgi:hypothetical protein